MSNNMFKKEDMKIYNPMDLNGKTLKILVSESEEVTVITGKDIDSGMIYILSTKFKTN